MSGRAVAIALLLAVAACSDSSEAVPTTALTTIPTGTEAAATTTAPQDEPAPETDTTTPQPSIAIALPATFDPTPAQAEGPYYPVAKPDDRDNNLLLVGDSTESAAGTPMEIVGLLLDTDGAPVAGATIEIWQVDASGIYDHPNDPGFEGRDLRFQGYGEATTDSAGMWSFLTLDPAVYEPRARHIHVKVVVDGAEVLTTQIYFEGDKDELSRDILAGRISEDALDLLTATYTEGTLSNGIDGVISTHVIVLDR